MVSPHSVALLDWSPDAIMQIEIIRMVVKHVSTSVHREPMIFNTQKSVLSANGQIFFTLNAVELLQLINFRF
jgi:hypothetical protein